MLTKSGENLLLEKESYTNKGVTLIEMLVAVTMFSITVGAISGLFISGIRSQRRVLATQELLNQTSYVLEYTGRALRMAKKDDSLGSCTGTPHLNYVKTESGNGIRFLNHQTKCQEFRLNTTTFQLEVRESTDYTSGNLPASWTDLTSDKLHVNSFNVNLSGATQPPADYLQPRVTIFLEIEGRETGVGRPKIQIQTSISQRDLDVQY